ncbi:MAG TPA: xanthine dehydrogenase family protein molybdopterin-binding subunit [Methylomirabilota bacterium]|nr:xanthine dehydrogenase family protein molybdopterin-binding subunit [Methylomirabilota bacterium]
MSTPATPKLVGARVPRVEDPRLLTGQGSYVDDHRPARMLYAAFLRTAHAHARIVRIDVDQARALPGVAAVVTGDQMAHDTKPVRAGSKMRAYKVTSFPPLAQGKVRYTGEAVAIVVAESRYLAEDAAERIVVEYEPLPPVGDMEAALASGAPVLHEEAGDNLLLSREFARGDVDAALAGAHLVVRERFRFRRHAVVCMENRGALAEYASATGTLTLRSSAQCPGLVRDVLADLLDMPEHLIRVVANDVGGGFGGKASLYPEEIAVCVMARRLGRPVKWIGDRREDLLATSQAWDEIIDAELGVTADGMIVGLRAEVMADVGAYSIYPWTAAIEPVQTISFLPGPYRLDHYRGRTRGVTTCKAPMGPYRGVGRPPAVFVMEGLIDRAARRLGMDPTEIRLENFIREEDFPYTSPSGIVWDRSSFTATMLRAREALGWETARAEAAKARASGRWVGVGVASYVELTGIGSAIPVSPGMPVPTGTEAATIRLDPSGTVTAVFGVASHGQGLETTLAQVVADELSVPIESVRVVHGDTGLSPYGTGTYASRSTVLAGGAGILASRDVRDKVLRIAAHLLEADAADLVMQDGRVAVRGMPDRRVTVRDVAKAAYGGVKHLPRGMEPGLEVTRFYDPFYGTASNATHMAVVEVDRGTFHVRILRYLVTEDCGQIINPLVVDGQVHGGVAQGVGAALLEEVVYDDEGQLLTGTLMDYLVPTASEIPEMEVHHIQTPSPTTLGGFRGMGEGGTIGAPAVLANAVNDALRDIGVEINELPITPERLFRLARRAGAV